MNAFSDDLPIETHSEELEFDDYLDYCTEEDLDRWQEQLDNAPSDEEETHAEEHMDMDEETAEAEAEYYEEEGEESPEDCHEY